MDTTIWEDEVRGMKRKVVASDDFEHLRLLFCRYGETAVLNGAVLGLSAATDRVDVFREMCLYAMKHTDPKLNLGRSVLYCYSVDGADVAVFVTAELAKQYADGDIAKREREADSEREKRERIVEKERERNNAASERQQMLARLHKRMKVSSIEDVEKHLAYIQNCVKGSQAGVATVPNPVIPVVIDSLAVLLDETRQYARAEKSIEAAFVKERDDVAACKRKSAITQMLWSSPRRILKETGQHFGITSSRVAQVEKDIERELRHRMHLVSKQASKPALDLELRDPEHRSLLSKDEFSGLMLAWLDLFDMELERREKGEPFWKEVWQVTGNVVS